MVVDALPIVGHEVLVEGGMLCFRQDGEELVGGAVDEEGYSLAAEGFADAGGLLVGVGGKGEVEAIGEERLVLDAQQTALGQHAATLLHDVAEVLFQRGVDDDDGFAEEGALLRTAEVEDIAEACQLRQCQIARAARQAIAEARAVDEERHVVAAADVVDGREFGFAVDGAILRRHGEIDHAGLYHVLVVAVGVMAADGGLNLLGINLAAHGRESQHLVAAMLDGAGLMNIDVTVRCADDALIGTKHGGDDSRVGLRAAHEEVNIGIGSLTGSLDQFAGMGAVFVLAVAGSLHEVRSHQTLQDGWMSAFVVITLELDFHS